MNPLTWLQWLRDKFKSYAKPSGYLVVSLIFLMVFPLLPLVTEQWLEHSIKPSTWAITAAIYSICTGAGSRIEVVFVFSILASFLDSVMYGVAEATPNVSRPEVAQVSFWVIVIFSLSLLLERFYRHVLQGKPFFEF